MVRFKYCPVDFVQEVRHKDLGETLLVKIFGYSPKLRILDVFLDNPFLTSTRARS